MYSSHIRSILEEISWRFQVKYLNFYSEWMVVLLPFILLLTLPYWLPKLSFQALKKRGAVVNILALGFILTLVATAAYIWAIIGEPNQKKWTEEIFPTHITRIATKVRDNQDNMLGILANPKLDKSNKSTLYIENVPKLYWSMLKDREEQYLNFNNHQIDFWGIINDPRSFNGIDPIGVPKSIIVNGRGGSSLSQQLVKNFYGQDYFNGLTSSRHLNTVMRKWQELNEAKTFYHNLKEKNGEEFKRWIAMYSPPLVSNGTVYGLESVSAVIFGKKPHELKDYEQILLSQMHKISYYFSPEKVNEKKCKLIKRESKRDINRYFSDDKKRITALSSEIDSWVCPKEPEVPLDFYNILQNLDDRKKRVYGNLNARVWKLAGSSTLLLRKELKEYQQKHPKHLVTEAKMTIDTAKNMAFKKGIDKALLKIEKNLEGRLVVDLDGNGIKEREQANIWISVVDDKGSWKHIYKRGNTSYKRRIGSLSKIFEAIALGARGDKWDYYYCNEPYKNVSNSDGNHGGKCEENGANIYSAMRVFGASKNLPLKSAFDKFVVKNNRGVKIVQEPIKKQLLKDIYHEFNLKKDSNASSMQYEMSFGMTNSTPLNLQKSIHKLTHLLYPTGHYKEAHIIDSLNYKVVRDTNLVKGGTTKRNYSTTLSYNIRKLFDTNTKIYMKTLLKAPLHSGYGTLRSFNTINGFKPLFIKSGTTDTKINNETLTQSKWTAGAIKVKGKNYSFVIMVERQKGIGRRIKHYEMMKPLFRELVKALLEH
ncbi:transglycosylase domain-containing protein [Sulfurovum sp. bin170]|uniref:transglycosylase domain-containing protein n=1 Tax=Sulfurovum sp. bin170 TaxID=2695268 RepID=UPI0013E0DBDC|nr:transglycosylase domain-containing protein [Sulfurovum sp. bin170]NEW59988.1 transglycosylase domain-containing protein [Sulfurovum sp. bin170]